MATRSDAHSGGLLNSPTIDEIAACLRAFASAVRLPAWTELLRMAGSGVSFGEMRDPLPLTHLPVDRAVRIVHLVDATGPVLRWLLPDEDVMRVLGGIYHDHLERGDGHGKALSGWLRREGEGGVRVWP